MRLDEIQLDALTEVVNIGVGRAAASLNSLVGSGVNLCVPRIRLVGIAELEDELEHSGEPVDTCVVQGFDGAISGRAMLAFPQKSGIALARMLADEPDAHEDDALDFDLAGILEEIGNIVLNGVLGSLGNVFEENFQYSVPELCNGSVTQALSRNVTDASLGDGPTCLLADAHFDLANSPISGSLLLAFKTDQLEVLLDRLIASVGA